MKKLFAALLTISAATSGFVFAQSKYTEADLVWTEEFNGKNLDSKIWNYELHDPGWVNKELQSYTNSKQNAYVKDGNLIIQPVRTVNKDGTVSYTSARLNSQHKKTLKYGRVEARIKMPVGMGYLPAFWMMPEDEELYGSWPKCGEIDIAEVLGRDPGTCFGTLHFGDPHAQRQGTYTLSDSTFDQDFHIYACEWEPDEIRFYVDGIQYGSCRDWYTKRPGFNEVTYPAPYDQEFYMIINVAIGGDWPGNPDTSTPFDERAQMKVDYIKIYQKPSYDENVPRPPKKPIDLNPDETGNLVKNTSTDWNFLTAGTGKGSMNFSNGEIVISSTDGGNLQYSVQAIQSDMPMEQGKVYKYSYDAWAESDRTIISCISQPTMNYTRIFYDTTVNLTKQKKHFEYIINMVEYSDPHGRIEFNLGAQDSTATVHISNVRLEQIGDVDFLRLTDPTTPDGNYLHNGQFNEGDFRLGSWETKCPENGKISVTNANYVRELKVECPKKCSPSDVQLLQKNIRLPKNTEVVLRFDARSTKTSRIQITGPGLNQNVRILSVPNRYELTFNTGDVEEFSQICFDLGNAGSTIFMDNISLKENILIFNGEFDRGIENYEVFTHGEARTEYRIIEEADGNRMFEIEIKKTGSSDWMIQLMQKRVGLVKGKRYVLKLRAKSDMNRALMFALQRDGTKDDNWASYSGTKKPMLTDQFQTFTQMFTMGNDTDDNVILSISMGAVNDNVINQTHKIWIDSITLEEIK